MTKLPQTKSTKSASSVRKLSSATLQVVRGGSKKIFVGTIPSSGG